MTTEENRRFISDEHKRHRPSCCLKLFKFQGSFPAHKFSLFYVLD